MRTTLQLEDDVVAAVRQLREAEHIGLSDAVNRLARLGVASMQHGGEPSAFVQVTHDLGLMIDVANVAEALERLEP